jgi:hypothetical protein
MQRSRDTTRGMGRRDERTRPAGQGPHRACPRRGRTDPGRAVAAAWSRARARGCRGRGSLGDGGDRLGDDDRRGGQYGAELCCQGRGGHRSRRRGGSGRIRHHRTGDEGSKRHGARFQACGGPGHGSGRRPGRATSAHGAGRSIPSRVPHRVGDAFRGHAGGGHARFAVSRRCASGIDRASPGHQYGADDHGSSRRPTGSVAGRRDSCSTERDRGSSRWPCRSRACGHRRSGESLSRRGVGRGEGGGTHRHLVRPWTQRRGARGCVSVSPRPSALAPCGSRAGVVRGERGGRPFAGAVAWRDGVN